ncbi:MAG: ATP-binding protein [Candidatus Bathyarchaeia archaeon]
MEKTRTKPVPLGYVHFDTPTLQNYISEFLIAQEMAAKVFRNKYVKIEDINGHLFVGRVVAGPFFLPEEVDRGSALAQTSILKGDRFPVVPNYYALSRIELFGELKKGVLSATNTRPLPKSPVTELTPKEVQDLIGLRGKMLLGRLLGYEDVLVVMDANSKKVFPRNIGIFGTVGAGKTNTAQVIIEETSSSGFAVVVIDIEGEYISMDEPSNELEEKLRSFGLKAEGLKDFHVYYPAAGECKRRSAQPFDIKFSSMDPYILSEILDFTEAQERVFFELIEKMVEKQLSNGGKKEGKSNAIKFIEGSVEEIGGKYTINDALRTLFGDIIPNQRGGEKAASYTLAKKFKKLNRARIFDQKNARALDVESMLKAGRVNVIDVSGCDEEVKNIVIAWLLKSVFTLKVTKTEKTPKTLILLEEAHTFVSREAKERMSATLDMIRTIARRGRKRWLCLGFISQQPAHLPNEIFELCNTRIIHSIKSEHNLQPLKATGGDIIEEVWNQISGLGVGQVVISSPQFNHPIQVDMRPAKSKREFID